MEYLKTYRLFESEDYKSSLDGLSFKDKVEEVKNIIHNVEDIFLELSDDNWDSEKERFNIKVKEIGPLSNMKDKLGIKINISRDSGFTLRDIEEFIERSDEYLKSEGYSPFVNVFDGYGYERIYRFKNNN